jgi:hypothetical protein
MLDAVAKRSEVKTLMTRGIGGQVSLAALKQRTAAYVIPL